jgi:hypothetical protein
MSARELRANPSGVVADWSRFELTCCDVLVGKRMRRNVGTSLEPLACNNPSAASTVLVIYVVFPVA